ncbi:hypothetical protein BDR04DRAFT_1105470 [Suillus decipiens]|nr:hypothetical protein BDR04DRAFT_1105470 [Suillus decipiens]
MSTDNKNTATKKNGGGGGFGNKLKGAAQVIHGMGENIRGTALGSADRATNSAASAQKNADLATKGRAEIAEGMAKLKGHAPPPPAAPAGAATATPGTVPADQGTTTGTGTGSGTDAAAATATPMVTDQGQQQGKGDEKTSADGGKSGLESTGPDAAQTSREAAVGAGAVHEQKSPGEAAAGNSAVPEQKSPGEAAAGTSAVPEQKSFNAVSQQEGKQDDRNVPERSQSGNTGQIRAQGATEEHPQQIGERSSQQKVDEQCKAGQLGVQQEKGRWAIPGEGQCELFHFQGISTDKGDEQLSQQTGEKSRDPGHEGVQEQGRWAIPGEGQCELFHFQGVSMDEHEKPSQTSGSKTA